MSDTSKIIYSINIEDVQHVANQELSRQLSMDELKMVEEKLGDYMDWYGSIASAINDMLNDRNENSTLPENHLLQEGS
jgi:hypothetical protein